VTRQNRLIVSMLAVGIVGIAALAFLAHQLESRLPRTALAEGLPPAAAPAPDRDAGAGAPPAAPRPMAAAGRVAGFIAVRTAEREVVAKHPQNFRQIEAALTENNDLVKGERTAADPDVVSEFILARIQAIPKAGLTTADYTAVRAAYRAWKAGSTVDPDLAAVLEARRDDLVQADLGGLEVLDDRIK
jgi:hypothetical protein